MFPSWMNPELLFLYVTAEPTGSLPDGSEALKKEKSREEDAERNPIKEYSKVCTWSKRKKRIFFIKMLQKYYQL